MNPPCGLCLPFIFILGLVIGSFLNVCICRIPAEESINSPRSHCPACGQAILARDNIPILSFMLLGGRCRGCGVKISRRYPIVELATGLLFVGMVIKFGLTGKSIIYAALGAALIVLSAIDLEHQILPDVITLPVLAIGLILALLSWLPVPKKEAVIGLLTGGGLLYFLAVISRGGMGGGDIKLAALMGVYLGWKALLVAMFLGVTLGGLVGIGLIVFGGKSRKDKIPFGPFLALGTLISIFWGQNIILWYQTFLV